MTKYVLALDQGTTGTTAILFDRDTQPAARVTLELPQHYPQPGWVEHDAEAIWRLTREAAAQALAAAGARAEDLAAIGITNQRETVVLWERATGAPIGRALVWQDRRTAEFCAELAARPGLAEDLRTRTGLVIDPYFSASKARWLLAHTPGLRARAERGEIAFGTIDSWLLHKLIGAHLTDPSNAARTQLFNIHEGRWDPALLALFEIPEQMLPAIAPSSGVLGETNLGGLLDRPVLVAGVAGDQQAALFGQGCFTSGKAKVTYGTGAFLLLHTGQAAAPAPGGLLSTIAWRLPGAPMEYALEGAILVAGAAVQWLRDGLGLIAHAAETEALAASLPGNEGVYFVPALTGLGAPHWDPYARGLMVGLTRGTGRAHLARAALEAIAYQTLDVVRAMEAAAGAPLRELRADGGASANAFLMQFQADLLGAPVLTPEVAETTALGAAYLAGLAVGFWADRAEIEAKWRLARAYEPRMSSDQREALHAKWLDAVSRAKGWAGP